MSLSQTRGQVKKDRGKALLKEWPGGGGRGGKLLETSNYRQLSIHRLPLLNRQLPVVRGGGGSPGGKERFDCCLTEK